MSKREILDRMHAANPGSVRSGGLLFNATVSVQLPDDEIQVTKDMYAPRSDYWVATFGDFDLDCLTGRGHTPLDAIVDLLDKAEC